MMRIRATDPRPCPKCGKIYRSAHTLRTHMEDKHTVCPGYRCVLCGTVAKSRNSLHSHMSRQHRGISTKDLPVVPMPAPFDAELASRLLAKAGVKVSANELAARASPTAPRRSDIPKLDSNLLNLHSSSQQFSLPSNVPASSATVLLHGRAISSGGSSGEAEDLRVPASSPFGLGHMRAGLNHKDFVAGASAHGGSMGSALLVSNQLAVKCVEYNKAKYRVYLEIEASIDEHLHTLASIISLANKTSTNRRIQIS